MNGVLTLGYTALAVRALGLEGFGLLVLIHTYVQTISEFSKLKSWQAILRYGVPAFKDGRIAELQRLIGLTISLDMAGGLIGCVIAFAGVGVVGPLLAWPDELLPIIALYGLAVFSITLGTPIGLLRLWNRFDLLAIRSMIGALVRLVGSAVLLVWGGDLGDFLVLWFIAAGMSLLSLVVFGWREAGRHGVLRGFMQSVRKKSPGFPGIWRLLGATYLSAAISSATKHFGTLLIGGSLGAAEAGIYRVAGQIAEAGSQPGKFLTPAIYPEIARFLASGNIAMMKAFVVRSVVGSSLLSVVFFAVIWLAGGAFLKLIGGAAAVPALDVLLLLSVATLLLMISFPFEPTLILVGLETTALHIRLAATAAYFPMLFLFLQWHGLAGAAMALIAANAITMVAEGTQTVRWFARQG